MRCEKCGETLSIREKFCGRCGADNKLYSADGMLKCSVCGKSYITPNEKCPYCNRDENKEKTEQSVVDNVNTGNTLPVYDRNSQYDAPPTTFKELFFAFLSQKMGINNSRYNSKAYRPLGKFVICPECSAECALEDNFCYFCGECLKTR